MLKLYLLEIRNRIGLIILSWLLVFFVCYWYKETLLFLFFIVQLFALCWGLC